MSCCKADKIQAYFNPRMVRASTNAEQVKLAFFAANAEAEKAGKKFANPDYKPVMLSEIQKVTS